MKITKTLFLKASPEHIWKFLTQADRLALWFHAGAADLTVGGDYKIISNSEGKEGEAMISGKVTLMVPPKKLVHSFTHAMLNNIETICTWTLEPCENGTILTLEHEGFEKLAENAFNIAAEHDKGWDEHFTRLRKVTC